MSFEKDFHHDCCDRGKDKCHHHCKGCVCDQLRNLPRNTTIAFSTISSGLTLVVTFLNFDRKTCCVRFRTNIGITQYEGFVNCEDIKTLTVV